jgi:hypothetical protein
MNLFPWRKRNETLVCPNCKCPVLPGSVFCDACGLRILAPPSCSKCNLPLAPDTNFCESCGTPVGEIKPPVAHIPADESVKVPAAPVPKKARKRRKKRKDGDNRGNAGNPAAVQEDRPSAGSGPVFPQKPGEESGVSASPGDQLITVLARAGWVTDKRLFPKNFILLGGAIVVVVLLFGIVFFTHPLAGPDPSSGKMATGSAGTTVTPGGVTDQNGIMVHNGTGALPSLLPLPTRVVPESMRIWFQAERDPITNSVTVLFDGGKGQLAVHEVQVRLTRSDGQVLTGSFRPLVIGEGISLAGTRYTDRLEVIVVYNSGETYPVIDKNFFHKERN